MSLILAFMLAASSQLPAQQVTRGPYLQLGTSNSMVIRWRTDVATIGKIHYGLETTTLDNEVTELSSTTEHELQIAGLNPATVYFYDIGTDSAILIPATANMYFKTSPIPGTRQPVRIWAIGDFGDGSVSQQAVRDAFVNYTGAAHTDVWLWLGDNAYGDGTQQQYQDYVFNIYPAQFRKIVAWPAPGNHDYGSVDLNNHGPYFDIFTLPENAEAGGVASGEEGFYSFDYGNVHFVSLNTEYLPWTLTSNTQMANWLDDDLENNDKDWTIAYWHQPPYTKGSHDSDEFFSRMGMMRSNINPILEEHGVDLVLCGHSHNYERSYMMHGHYGTSNTFDPATMIVDSTSPFVKYTDGVEPNKGTIYMVVGCAGKLSNSGSLDHAAMVFSTDSFLGSLIVDVSGDTLNAKFLTSSGAVKDEFAMVKTIQNPSTGLDELQEDVLRIVPNPTQNSINVQFHSQGKTSLSLYDMQGNLISGLFSGEVKDGETMTFPATDYPAGVYLLRYRNGNHFSAHRVFIRK